MKEARRCPVGGCAERATVHKDDGETAVFSCPRHGARLRAPSDSLKPMVSQLAGGPSPHKGLPSAAELQMCLLNRRRSLYDHYRRRIADRFVKQFASEKLVRSPGSHLYKFELYRAWREWFGGHYYEMYVTSWAVGQVLKAMGYRDDPGCRYFLDVELKTDAVDDCNRCADTGR